MSADTKTTKPSDSTAVDAYMNELKHPMKELAIEVRRTILESHPSIGEEIKWNAPAFFYTGPMEPFNPKEYRRHLIVFNFYRQESLRLVFWHGDKANNTSGFLTGDYSDGRRLAILANAEELQGRRKALIAAVRSQLKAIGK